MEERAQGPSSLLDWKVRSSGFAAYQEAVLGDFYSNGNDGVRFSLAYHPACPIRGRWKLLIEIGDFGKWGFEEADQPLRFYHSLETAKSESQAIANALLLNRFASQEIDLSENNEAKTNAHLMAKLLEAGKRVLKELKEEDGVSIGAEAELEEAIGEALYQQRDPRRDLT